MPVRNDYHKFLDSASSGIVVLVPVCNADGTIFDFRIVYMNSFYTNAAHGLVRTGQCLSEITARILFTIDWLTVCAKAVTQGSLSPHYIIRRLHRPISAQLFAELLQKTAINSVS